MRSGGTSSALQRLVEHGTVRLVWSPALRGSEEPNLMKLGMPGVERLGGTSESERLVGAWHCKALPAVLSVVLSAIGNGGDRLS